MPPVDYSFFGPTTASAVVNGWSIPSPLTDGIVEQCEAARCGEMWRGLTTQLISMYRFQVFIILPSMILPRPSDGKIIEGKMMRKQRLRMLFNGSWLWLSGVRVDRAGRE